MCVVLRRGGRRGVVGVVVVVVFVVVVVLRWHEAVMRNGINGALSFWSVEEIVGEFGKRARACGTVAEHAVQCNAVPCSQSSGNRQTDTDPSIHPSLASINPSIDVTHFTSYLLTHSLTQSVTRSPKHLDRFIYFLYRRFGWQNLTQKIAKLVQLTPEKLKIFNFF